MSRVLIIEDEVEIADLEKDYLELSGFEVEIEKRSLNWKRIIWRSVILK